MSPFYDTKRAGYRAQRSASQGASITLVSGCGEWKTSFDCATRAAAVLGNRELQDLGDGIFESIPVMGIPTELLCVSLQKLTARYSVALVDLVCTENNSSFVLLWKIEQRVSPTSPTSENISDETSEDPMFT